MARTCWAHSLGGCDSLSGEHIISNAIFKHGCGCPTVIEGVPRIRNGAPTRGAETSNILCRSHNSMLSPLDEVVGRLSKHLHESEDESYSTNINLRGEMLERWGLKTIINMSAAGWFGRKFEPSPDIVAAIYGKANLPDGCGLYSVDGVYRNEQGEVRSSVTFTGIYEMRPAGRVLAGGYLAIHGMPLFFSLGSDVVQRIEASGAPAIQERLGNQPLRHLYRPGAIVSTRKRGLPIHVGLSWNGILRYADGTTSEHVD